MATSPTWTFFLDNEQQFSNLWVIYSASASATDTDLFIRRYLDDFSGPGVTVYSDLSNNWDTNQGQIAGLGGSNADKTVTAFTRWFSSGPKVRWHMHAKNDATLNSTYGAAPGVTGSHEWRPDVGGTKASVVGTTALIVHQREIGTIFTNTSESAVVGFMVDTSTGLNGTVTASELALGGAANRDAERPSVNQAAEGGVAFSWVIAYQYFNNATGTDWDIVARRVFKHRSTRSRTIVCPPNLA